MLIKLLSCVIPVKKWRKKFREYAYKNIHLLQNKIMPLGWRIKNLSFDKLILSISDYLKLQKRYKKIVRKKKNKNKLNVAFLVHWPFSWSAENVAKQMLKDESFEVSIIVAPTLVYNEKERLEVYKETLEFVKKKYSDVKILEAYDFNLNKMVDCLKDIDIIFLPSNDEKIEPDEYKIYNIIQKDILPCYICYAYYAAKDDAIQSDTYNLCWKVFVENKLNYKDLKERQQLKGQNAFISGYPKADSFAGLSIVPHERKKIIIAPHHSIHAHGLCSQFLKYYELFLELPDLYPQIDFIFRPHPLLYLTLSQPNWWGEEKTKEYFEKISGIKNVTYDTTPFYYQTFLDSDAIIHDCGSFLPEYLFSTHPACYMLKDKESIEQYFNACGKECLKHYYQAFCREDIIKFINEVVLSGNDYKNEERNNFAKTALKENFPNASKTIINYIKGEIQ